MGVRSGTKRGFHGWTISLLVSLFKMVRLAATGVGSMLSSAKIAMLTIAERRVAKLVAEGHRNSDIAQALGKSISTVKSQLMTIFSKLDIGSRTQLAALLRSC